MRRTALLALGLLVAAQGPTEAKPSRGGCAAEPPRRADESPRLLIKQDEQLYTKGSYIAYAAPWSAKTSNLSVGKDFVNTIAIREDTFPAQTRLAWHWPLDTPTKTGVRGYDALSYGNYDSGMPEHPVTPVRVRDIRAGWQSFDWHHDLIAGDFNLLAELYLTRTAGDPNAKVVEIGFILHVPTVTRAWIGQNPPLARWRDTFGTDWSITRNQGPGIPYITLIPASGADLYKGRLDVKGAVGELRRLGVIKGDEWLNGVAFGAEPISGSGSVAVTDWTVHW
jgi:hypothetical protein